MLKVLQCLQAAVENVHLLPQLVFKRIIRGGARVGMLLPHQLEILHVLLAVIGGGEKRLTAVSNEGIRAGHRTALVTVPTTTPTMLPPVGGSVTFHPPSQTILRHSFSVGEIGQALPTVVR